MPSSTFVTLNPAPGTREATRCAPPITNGGASSRATPTFSDAGGRLLRRFRRAALGMISLLLGWPHEAALAEGACVPAVQVVGDADLTAEVSAALGRRGVGAEGTDACPALGASLLREDGIIVVSRRDPAGREVERKVVQVEEAASVIESWVRPDLGADLMAGWSVDDAARVETPPAQEARRDPASIVVTGDLSLDGSDSLWLGTSIDACVRLGPTCLGGAARYRQATGSGRTEIAALATVDLPLRLGPIILAPGIALGGAGLSRFDDSGGGDDHGGGSWRLRGEGRLRLSIPLWGPVSFDADTAAELSPAGVTRREDGDDDSHHVVKDPTYFFRVGAGLRVGLP